MVQYIIYSFKVQIFYDVETLTTKKENRGKERQYRHRCQIRNHMMVMVVMMTTTKMMLMIMTMMMRMMMMMIMMMMIIMSSTTKATGPNRPFSRINSTFLNPIVQSWEEDLIFMK